MNKDLKSRIKQILTNYPTTRDSDHALMAQVWVEEMPFQIYVTFESLARYWSSGTLSAPESIKRLRQDLQGHNPELRGKFHGKRRERAQEIRKQVVNGMLGE